MTRLNTFVCAGLMALIASPVVPVEPLSANFMILYDLDATDATYCKVTGEGESPYGSAIAGAGAIGTSGSSATTTEVADTDPFSPMAVRDIFWVDLGTGSENVLVRSLLTKTSVSEVVVNSAWNLGSDGYFFRWKKTSCGTAATDGWIDVGGASTTKITFHLDQVNVTGGVDMRIECKGAASGSLPVQVFPICASGACDTYQNYTTAGIASRTAVVLGPEPWSVCRVGVKIGSADDGGDTGANAEVIWAGVERY